MAQKVKNPPEKGETWVQSLGWEDPLEESMATHCIILAWRILMDRGAWWAAVHGIAESRTRLSDLSREQHNHIYWACALEPEAATTEACVPQSPCSSTREAPQREACVPQRASPPLAATRGKAQVAVKTQSSQNQTNNFFLKDQEQKWQVILYQMEESGFNITHVRFYPLTLVGKVSGGSSVV